MHSIQARLIGDQPRHRRDGIATRVDSMEDSCWLTVDYLSEPGRWAGWHHNDLVGKISTGDPLRIHERFNALQTGRTLVCVETIDGLGSAPDPVDASEWREDGRAVIVDLAEGTGIDVGERRFGQRAVLEDETCE